MSNSQAFGDVAADNWANDYIASIAAKGIINGDGKGNYLPGQNITRAQFAALIMRAFKLVDDNATCNFSDVKDGAWYYKEVASASKLGIITGIPDGTFAPDKNITRQEMAVIIARTMKYVNGKSDVNSDKYIDGFHDKSTIAAFAADSVSLNVKYGLVKGIGKNFEPVKNASRAEAAAIVYRLLNM